jgi:hypothetical protein
MSYLMNDPQKASRARLEQDLRKTVPAFAEKLLPLLRPAITLSPEPALKSAIPLGASKIGGLPDLPGDVEWPQTGTQPLLFIAQINLAEVAPFDTEGLLPHEGLLSFFSDIGSSLLNRVLWLPTSGLLRATEFPSKKTAEPGRFLNRIRSLFQRPQISQFPTWTLQADLDWQLPAPEAPELELVLTNAEQEIYAANLWDDLERAREPHQLLGYPSTCQENVQIMEARETTGPSQVEPAAVYRAALEWRLVLQIGELGDPDDNWLGDGGTLCFLLHQNDLNARRFENSRLSHDFT